MSDIKNIIAEGKAILGIEFGSTRIKAVLINPEDFKPVAQGAHEWENRLENGLSCERLGVQVLRPSPLHDLFRA